MAHALIAKANSEKQFAADLGCPEFYVRRVLIVTPGVIAAFRDAEFDHALEVDATKLMLAHLSGDDPKAQSTSGARRGLEKHAGIERVFYKRRFARGGTNLIKPGGFAAESVAITGQEKDVFCTAKRAQLVGSRGGKYRQSRAVPDLPARLFASGG
jgi:hypothetical protein